MLRHVGAVRSDQLALTVVVPSCIFCSHQSTVRELSLNLYLHQAGSAANDRTGLSPLEKIASIMSRHLHLLSSLSLAQRGDLISAFLLYVPAHTADIERQSVLILPAA